MKLGGITSSLEGLSGMVPEDQAAQIGAMLSELDNIYSTSVGIQATQLIYSQAYWTGLKLAKKSEELYDILKVITSYSIHYTKLYEKPIRSFTGNT